MYYETDAPAVINGGSRNDGVFGGDGFWAGIIGLIAVAAIFGGNGGGLFGGNRNADASIQGRFDTQTIVSKLDGISNGICDSTFALNSTMTNGFSGVQQTLCQGFSGVNGAIERQGYESRLATQGLSAQLASCCCDLKGGLGDIKYALATESCATRQAIADSTNAIIGFMTNQELAALRNENQSLKFAASQTAQNAFIAANQEAQTAELIRRLGRDCPIPAYVVPNPNCCYPNGYGYGNNGCGCNG